MENYRVIELLKEIKSIVTGKISSDKFMDINGVVNYSSCSKSTIRRAVSDGSLICSKATGKLLFKKTAVENWLNG